MGHLVRLFSCVACLSWTGIATAESAPATPQWSAPAPPTATAAPPASAPQNSPSPFPNVPVPVPVPVPDSPPGPPTPPTPAAPPPVAYPYPLYPAPPGYAYGYYYPPPPEVPKLRYPDNAAVSSTPFFDLLVAGVSWENRFSQFLDVGAQAGVYLGERVRLTVRGAIPSDKLNDEYYSDRAPLRSPDAAFLYGASAGVVVVGTKNFVLSPGVAFMRSDVSDYGTMIALSMPFEWVMPTGLRVGFEVNLGRAVAGHTRFQNCTGSVCAGGAPVDRPAGTGFWMQFQLGYGFNHPAPLPPEPPPRAAPLPLAPR
jgi:hypothetical protein